MTYTGQALSVTEWEGRICRLWELGSSFIRIYPIYIHNPNIPILICFWYNLIWPILARYWLWQSGRVASAVFESSDQIRSVSLIPNKLPIFLNSTLLKPNLSTSNQNTCSSLRSVRLYVLVWFGLQQWSASSLLSNQSIDPLTLP